MSRVARLGVFVVVTLAILAVGVFIIGSQKYLFHSTYQLKAKFDNVTGLAAGADVEVGGVHCGTVHSIEMPRNPGEQITVLIDLDKSTRAIVKHDSIASIQTEGLLGSQYLAISFGSTGQADVADGETIGSVAPLQMGDLLKKADVLLDGSQQAIENTTQITAHLSSVTAKVDRGQGTVGALVNDRQLYSNLEQSTSALQGTILQAKSGVTSFSENMEALKHNFLLRGYFKKRGYEDTAEITAYRASGLPKATPIKVFTFASKQLFSKEDSASLKNQHTLNASGEFLAQGKFGYAVIVVKAGMQGNTQKEQVLTEARATNVRAYLVDHFGFDDSRVKTLGLGKQSVSSEADPGGSVEILIYSEGTEAAPGDDAPPASAPVPAVSAQPANLPEAK